MGRGKGPVTDVVNPNEATKVATDAGADIAEAVVPNTSSFKPRVYPGTILNKRRPKIINPNEDNPYVRTPPGTMRRFKGGGIAKRGMGAMLIKAAVVLNQWVSPKEAEEQKKR